MNIKIRNIQLDYNIFDSCGMRKALFTTKVKNICNRVHDEKSKICMKQKVMCTALSKTSGYMIAIATNI